MSWVRSPSPAPLSPKGRACRLLGRESIGHGPKRSLKSGRATGLETGRGPTAARAGPGRWSQPRSLRIYIKKARHGCEAESRSHVLDSFHAPSGYRKWRNAKQDESIVFALPSPSRSRKDETGPAEITQFELAPWLFDDGSNPRTGHIGRRKAAPDTKRDWSLALGQPGSDIKNLVNDSIRIVIVGDVKRSFPCGKDEGVELRGFRGGEIPSRGFGPSDPARWREQA